MNQKNDRKKASSPSAISLIIMALFYFTAGCFHFIKPGSYSAFMPPWVPYHREMIFLSGFFEVLFAILLLPRRSRRPAAWGIILLLVAVFPANIQMTLNFYRGHHPGFWLSVARLPLQFVLIWWAAHFTGPRR